MKKFSFIGIDASLEISLLEYGLLMSTEQNTDGSGTYFCVYKITDNSFGTGHISEKEINGYLTGKEFPDEDDINSFLSWCGLSLDEWLNNSPVSKLYDLISFWGSENIMGSDYCPMTEIEVINRYLDNYSINNL